MPELPEVESIRRHLAATISGCVIAAVQVREERLRRPVDKVALHSVVGHRIVSFGRRGKYLLAHLDDGRALVVHLGMSGHLQLCAPGLPMHKHDHVIFVLGRGMELRYNDPRRFGAMWLLDGPPRCEEFLGLGLEPFDQECTVHYFRERAARRRVAVKVFLMDGRTVAGVGNIYANEALYHAGIDPRRPAASLSLAEWQRLRRALRAVLRAAIRRGGATLRDERFRNPEGQSGLFQVKFKVYAREGLPCGRCGGTISRVVVGGRSTYFCPACQR